MADIVQVLPDSVANQIAAGEVIQRPASVVKEMVENAVDANATEIKVILKDAGKTSIQIVDNGTGMTDTDARLAFERHSTSKIKNAEDLFAIKTMGFRGEALASIAAIAHVEMKTRTKGDEIGTYIRIEGSKVISQEPAQCPVGSNFTVKNLFFNVPARRKFLKKDSTELNHIIKEFQRIALAYTHIKLSLYHNENVLFHLPEENYGKRILSVFGSKMKDNLIPLETNTNIVKVFGYVGLPQKAKKRYGEQFFFVNNRFMRSPYLHKAIMECYDNLVRPGNVPVYFIYLEIPPGSIDVNIHPTKTEVKFEDQQAVWQVLHASVREALGKHNIAPSIDFDQDGNIGIPTPTRKREVQTPRIEVDPTYNPFENNKSTEQFDSANAGKSKKNSDFLNWEELYDTFENKENQPTLKFESAAGKENKMEREEFSNTEGNRFFQYKYKYILTPVKSGLMLIHQQRCHVKILYEYFLANRKKESNIVQKRLYPEEIELNPADFAVFQDIYEDVKKTGFQIELKDNRIVEIHGVPAETDFTNVKTLMEDFLARYDTLKNSDISSHEGIALSLARAAAISSGTPLTYEEMRELVDKLFACSTPNYTPEGQKIISLIKLEEIEKLF
ncbi:MAG: DNA mismatch repair endonuclease MutL [Bacteroidales bacterium]